MHKIIVENLSINNHSLSKPRPLLAELNKYIFQRDLSFEDHNDFQWLSHRARHMREYENFTFIVPRLRKLVFAIKSRMALLEQFPLELSGDFLAKVRRDLARVKSGVLALRKRGLAYCAYFRFLLSLNPLSPIKLKLSPRLRSELFSSLPKSASGESLADAIKEDCAVLHHIRCQAKAALSMPMPSLLRQRAVDSPPPRRRSPRRSALRKAWLRLAFLAKRYYIRRRLRVLCLRARTSGSWRPISRVRLRKELPLAMKPALIMFRSSNSTFRPFSYLHTLRTLPLWFMQFFYTYFAFCFTFLSFFWVDLFLLMLLQQKSKVLGSLIAFTNPLFLPRGSVLHLNASLYLRNVYDTSFFFTTLASSLNDLDRKITPQFSPWLWLKQPWPLVSAERLENYKKYMGNALYAEELFLSFDYAFSTPFYAPSSLFFSTAGALRHPQATRGRLIESPPRRRKGSPLRCTYGKWVKRIRARPLSKGKYRNRHRFPRGEQPQPVDAPPHRHRFPRSDPRHPLHRPPRGEQPQPVDAPPHRHRFPRSDPRHPLHRPPRGEQPQPVDAPPHRHRFPRSDPRHPLHRPPRGEQPQPVDAPPHHHRFPRSDPRHPLHRPPRGEQPQPVDAPPHHHRFPRSDPRHPLHRPPRGVSHKPLIET